MNKLILSAAALLFLAAALPADDKADKVKKLKEQIAETEKKLADLKKDLAKETPEVKYTDAKENLWGRGAPEVGTRGELATTDHRVVDVIDETAAAIRFGLTANGPVFIVRGISTKGWADDMYVRASGAWNVTGTTKYRGKTVFELAPAYGSTSFEKAK